MADYFTQFSVMFPVGSSTNVEPALALFRELEEQLDRDEGTSIGFTAESVDEDPTALWLYSDGHGEPEHVITFAMQCGEAFGLTGRWGFCWALSCSRTRLDGFGGGAHVLDLATGDTIEWLDCEHWLTDQLSDQPAGPGSGQATEVATQPDESDPSHRRPA